MNVEKPSIRIMCIILLHIADAEQNQRVARRTHESPGPGAKWYKAGEKEEFRANGTKRKLIGKASCPWSALAPTSPTCHLACPPLSPTCKDPKYPLAVLLAPSLSWKLFPLASNHSFMYASIYSANVY